MVQLVDYLMPYEPADQSSNQNGIVQFGFDDNMRIHQDEEETQGAQQGGNEDERALRILREQQERHVQRIDAKQQPRDARLGTPRSQRR